MTESDARTYFEQVLGVSTRRPHLVLSHADRDHYGWIPRVLEGTQLDHIWQGGDPGDYDQDGFPNWLRDQEQGGARARADFAIGFNNDLNAIVNGPTCGDASVFVLTVNSGGSKNADSLVLAIDYEDFSVTFTGDAEGTTETSARNNFDQAVKTTVLSGSHHGASSHGSNGSKWVDATAPEIIVFSAGRKFGHPRCDVVNRFSNVLADAPSHPVRCGLDNTRYRNQQPSTRAEYMTEFNGRVVITSNGQSPARLNCTGTGGCSAEIQH
jgi:beta-lactamase superfamily II metal-dependent hydrolase